jgi:hypothetical protein
MQSRLGYPCNHTYYLYQQRAIGRKAGRAIILAANVITKALLVDIFVGAAVVLLVAVVVLIYKEQALGHIVVALLSAVMSTFIAIVIHIDKNPFIGPPLAHCSPGIDWVTTLAPVGTQQIVIHGHCFGSLQRYVGTTQFIEISDITRNWNAGDNGTLLSSCWPSSTNDTVWLHITSWTSAEVDIAGFTNGYGRGAWTLQAQDKVEVQIWNPETLAGPACRLVRVLG